MREIKFRVYDKLKHKTLTGGSCMDVSQTQGVDRWVFGIDLFNHPDDVEIMQFTGLTDRHGKEIYEGDICLLPNGEKRFVRYDAPSFYLAKNDDLVDVDAFSTPGIYEEVIGNIYENPELLTTRNTNLQGGR